MSEDDPDKFKYRSYNFFVYPRGKRQKFLCQGESLRFLSSQNFDFNKLFRDGISCCPQDEATKLRVSFDEKNAKRELYDKPDEEANIEVPEEERESLKHIRYILISRTKDFKINFNFVSISSESVEKFLLSDEKEKVIGNCNPFQRRLIYQILKLKFGKQIFASSRSLPNSNHKVGGFNYILCFI